MFSTTVCPWCDRAAEAIAQRGASCKKINFDNLGPDGNALAMVVMQQTRQNTVPNIIIDKTHIGGYGELMEVMKRCESRDERIPADLCQFFNA